MRASIDHVVPYSRDTGQRPSFDYPSRCQDLPRMANSCNRLSLLVELSNKRKDLLIQRINHLLSPALKLHYTARKNLSPAPRGVSLQPYLRPRDCDHVSIRRFSLPLTFFKPIPGDQEKSLILRPDCQNTHMFSGPRCPPREFPLCLNE